MKEQLINSARANYVSPECEALQIKSENLVCISPGVLNAIGLYDITEGHGLNDDTSGWGNNY